MHDPFYALGNLIGDAILIGAVLAVCAVPVVLLHLAVRQARRALLERDK